MQQPLNFDWFYQFMEHSPKSVRDLKDWWTQEEGNVFMLNLYHLNSAAKHLDAVTRDGKA